MFLHLIAINIFSHLVVINLFSSYTESWRVKWAKWAIRNNEEHRNIIWTDNTTRNFVAKCYYHHAPQAPIASLTIHTFHRSNWFLKINPAYFKKCFPFSAATMEPYLCYTELSEILQEHIRRESMFRPGSIPRRRTVHASLADWRMLETRRKTGRSSLLHESYLTPA